MKQVTINYIKMTNWRTRNRQIDLNGRNARLLGRNKSGKSSVLDGFLWCLFGSDQQNRSNYHLFDDRVEQTHENAVPAEIELSLKFESGDVVFRRVATQGWVRKRGTDTYERSGSDNYSYFVDGIERSAKQYAEDIETFFGIPMEKLKIILNPSYFLSLNWQDQRRLLGDIIGEVREEDFAEDYSAIFKELERYSISEVKEKYKSLLNPEKEALKTIPLKIEALSDQIPDTSGTEAARVRIGEIEEEIHKIDSLLTDKAKAADDFLKKSMEEAREISALEAELEGLRRDFYSQKSPEVEAAEKELADANAHNASLAREMRERDSERARAEVALSSAKTELEIRLTTNDNLKQELARNKAKEFTADRCAYCGQPLPEDKIVEAKLKFNEAKNREHDEIVARGKENKKCIEMLRATVAEKEANIADLDAKTFAPIPIQPIEAKLARISSAKPKFEQSSVFAGKVAEIEEKRAKMTKVPSTSDPELVARKEELRRERDAQLRILELEASKKRLEDAIERLREDNKETAIAAAQHEGFLKLIASYEKDKAQIIRQRVSSLFSYCSVQMETVDKSGNTVPTCVIMDANGVSALVTNLEARVNCQIDIARAFAKYYGCDVPVFIDNSESINEENMPSLPCQTVIMRVTDSQFNVSLE